jgi:hypothetical protein
MISRLKSDTARTLAPATSKCVIAGGAAEAGAPPPHSADKFDDGEAAALRATITSA